MNRYKKIMIITYVIIFVLFCFFGIKNSSIKREMRSDINFESDIRIFDDADLLNSTEETKLDKELREIIKKEKTDVAIVTTNNTNGKSPQQYAQDFFIQKELGYERVKGTGILILIDMDTSVTGKREIWITTSGDVKKYISNDRCTKISESLTKDCANAKFYLAFTKFLDSTKKYMNSSSSVPDFLRNNFALFWIAAIGTAVFVFVKVKTFGMKNSVSSSTYLNGNSIKTNSESDTFLGTTVTTRIIQDNNSGSDSFGGGDSGGSSNDFGGGGASF